MSQRIIYNRFNYVIVVHVTLQYITLYYWLSPLGAWLNPGACNSVVISALAYAKKLGSKNTHII